MAEYLDRLRYVHTTLDGGALMQMGFDQGPAIGRVLARIRDAKLDGEVSSREEELALARSLLG